MRGRRLFGASAATSAATLSLLVAVASCHFPGLASYLVRRGRRALPAVVEVGHLRHVRLSMHDRIQRGHGPDLQRSHRRVPAARAERRDRSKRAAGRAARRRAAHLRSARLPVLQQGRRGLPALVDPHARASGVGVRFPVSCECGTAGTQIDTEVCHSQCEDVASTTRNCPSVFDTDSTVDLTSLSALAPPAAGASRPHPRRPACAATGRACPR